MLVNTKINEAKEEAYETIRTYDELLCALRRGTAPLNIRLYRTSCAIEVFIGEIARIYLATESFFPSICLDSNFMLARNLLPLLDEWGLELTDGWPIDGPCLELPDTISSSCMGITLPVKLKEVKHV